MKAVSRICKGLAFPVRQFPTTNWVSGSGVSLPTVFPAGKKYISPFAVRVKGISERFFTLLFLSVTGTTCNEAFTRAVSRSGFPTSVLLNKASCDRQRAHRVFLFPIYRRQKPASWGAILHAENNRLPLVRGFRYLPCAPHFYRCTSRR